MKISDLINQKATQLKTEGKPQPHNKAKHQYPTVEDVNKYMLQNPGGDERIKTPSPRPAGESKVPPISKVSVMPPGTLTALPSTDREATARMGSDLAPLHPPPIQARQQLQQTRQPQIQQTAHDATFSFQ